MIKRSDPADLLASNRNFPASKNIVFSKLRLELVIISLMNTRLHSIYDALQSSNLDSFLRNDIELDNNWGKQIWGMLLIVVLQEEVKKSVQKFQDELERLEPENLSFPTYESLHLTINQVVHGLENEPAANQQVWDKIKDNFLPKLARLNNTFPKIGITFSNLIPTRGGIIWCATDENDEVEELRKELFEILPFPKELIKENHIIHTTVARYKNKLNDPQKVLDFIKSQTQEIPMAIEEIFLRNELVFPSKEVQDIVKIELK